VIHSETEHCCNNCAAVLAGQPEYEHSERFLRCSSCGAKNLVALKITIIGCRRLPTSVLASPVHSIGQTRDLSNLAGTWALCSAKASLSTRCCLSL